jgi:hypothetical protein
MLARGAKLKEHAMSQKLNSAIAVIGIDIGKNSFHLVGHYKRGAIVLRQKWSRGQVEARLASTVGWRWIYRVATDQQPASHFHVSNVGRKIAK